MFEGENFAVFTVFRSIVNFFPRIMALSIGNVSLQACYRKNFPRMAILYPNRESFPTRKFCPIRYAVVSECNDVMILTG